MAFRKPIVVPQFYNDDLDPRTNLALAERLRKSDADAQDSENYAQGMAAHNQQRLGLLGALVQAQGQQGAADVQNRLADVESRKVDLQGQQQQAGNQRQATMDRYNMSRAALDAAQQQYENSTDPAMRQSAQEAIKLHTGVIQQLVGSVVGGQGAQNAPATRQDAPGSTNAPLAASTAQAPAGPAGGMSFAPGFGGVQGSQAAPSLADLLSKAGQQAPAAPAAAAPAQVSTPTAPAQAAAQTPAGPPPGMSTKQWRDEQLQKRQMGMAVTTDRVKGFQAKADAADDPGERSYWAGMASAALNETAEPQMPASMAQGLQVQRGLHQQQIGQAAEQAGLAPQNPKDWGTLATEFKGIFNTSQKNTPGNYDSIWGDAPAMSFVDDLVKRPGVTNWVEDAARSALALEPKLTQEQLLSRIEDMAWKGVKDSDLDVGLAGKVWLKPFEEFYGWDSRKAKIAGMVSKAVADLAQPIVAKIHGQFASQRQAAAPGPVPQQLAPGPR